MFLHLWTKQKDNLSQLAVSKPVTFPWTCFNQTVSTVRHFQACFPLIVQLYQWNGKSQFFFFSYFMNQSKNGTEWSMNLRQPFRWWNKRVRSSCWPSGDICAYVPSGPTLQTSKNMDSKAEHPLIEQSVKLGETF